METFKLIVQYGEEGNLKTETISIDKLVAIQLSKLLSEQNYEDLRVLFNELKDASGVVHSIDIDEIQGLEMRQ